MLNLMAIVYMYLTHFSSKGPSDSTYACIHKEWIQIKTQTNIKTSSVARYVVISSFCIYDIKTNSSCYGSYLFLSLKSLATLIDLIQVTLTLNNYFSNAYRYLKPIYAEWNLSLLSIGPVHFRLRLVGWYFSFLF